MKRKVLKLNENLIDYTKSATWNVWRQFGFDLGNHKGDKINVQAYYMPQEEQDRLVELLYKNGKVYKKYSRMYQKRVINWEILDFPTSDFDCLKRNISKPTIPTQTV